MRQVFGGRSDSPADSQVRIWALDRPAPSGVYHTSAVCACVCVRVISRAFHSHTINLAVLVWSARYAAVTGSVLCRTGADGAATKQSPTG